MNKNLYAVTGARSTKTILAGSPKEAAMYHLGLPTTNEIYDTALASTVPKEFSRALLFDAWRGGMWFARVAVFPVDGQIVL